MENNNEFNSFVNKAIALWLGGWSMLIIAALLMYYGQFNIAPGKVILVLFVVVVVATFGSWYSWVVLAATLAVVGIPYIGGLSDKGGEIPEIGVWLIALATVLLWVWVITVIYKAVKRHYAEKITK